MIRDAFPSSDYACNPEAVGGGAPENGGAPEDGAAPVPVSSVADADLDLLVALVALDEAAPVELAVAALHALLAVRRVAAVAAHQVASVQAFTPLKHRDRRVSMTMLCEYSSRCMLCIWGILAKMLLHTMKPSSMSQFNGYGV